MRRSNTSGPSSETLVGRSSAAVGRYVSDSSWAQRHVRRISLRQLRRLPARRARRRSPRPRADRNFGWRRSKRRSQRHQRHGVLGLGQGGRKLDRNTPLFLGKANFESPRPGCGRWRLGLAGVRQATTNRVFQPVRAPVVVTPPQSCSTFHVRRSPGGQVTGRMGVGRTVGR